jgi:spore maturation protein CgeB
MTALPRVFLYGDSHIRASGGWCYAEAFRELGAEVHALPDDAGLEGYERSLPLKVFRRLWRRPLERHRRAHVARLLDAVRGSRAELIVVLRGLLLGRADVAALRALGAVVVIVNHDDFFSRTPSNRSSRQLEALPEYDRVFATRRVNVGEVAPINPRVEFFTFAYHPPLHRIVPMSDEERARWASDVLFVGTWEDERARLLEHLAATVPARYAIYGNQWERLSRRSPLRPFTAGRAAVGDDMAKAIAASKIALGFLRKRNRDDYTQRSFEIPACGGVLLAERTERHREIFEEGKEVELFDPGDPAELVAKVRRLLDDSAHRERLRAAGLAAVLRGAYTYRDRARQLLEGYEVARSAR